MAVRIDPEQNERAALVRIGAQFRDARILEVGCGDGRLTVRLARLGARVEAIDPDAASIRLARRQRLKLLPARLARNVRYHVGEAEHLDYPAESFDRVVFAWSLC